MRLRNLFLSFLLVLLTACPSFSAAKATPVEFLLSQVRNSTGSLAGGTVTFYAAGTTTLKTIWLDRAKATPAANPYTLDANGTAQLYASGIYKIVIKNAAGSTIYTRDNLPFGLVDGPWIDVSEYASLTAAVTAIGSTPATLLVNDATTLTAGTTIPSTLALEVTPIGSINQGAYTLTINGSVDFPDKQVFTGTGAVSGTGLKETRPEWWGALGNGTADDTEAVQDALDAVNTKGTVYLTAGRTYIAGKASGHTAECLEIAKEGAIITGGGTLKRINNVTADIYFFRISANSVVLDGITIDGNYAARGTESAIASNIRSSNYDKGIIRNCKILDSIGMGIDLGEGSDYWELSNNYVEGFRRSGIQISSNSTVGQDPCNYNKIVGNIVVGDAPSTIRAGDGIFITTSSDSTPQNDHFSTGNVISDNIVIGAPDGGIESGYKCLNTTISNNTIINSFTAGIYVRDNQNTTVSGNNIIGRTTYANENEAGLRVGIFMDGDSMYSDSDADPILVGLNTVTSNNISNVKDAGITLTSSSHSNVSNNTIQGVAEATNYGINLKSSGSKVSENIISDVINGIRLSLEASQHDNNSSVLENVTVAGNSISFVNKAIELDFDADATGGKGLETFQNSDISGNRISDLTETPDAGKVYGFSGFSGTASIFNVRADNNLQSDNPTEYFSSQVLTNEFIPNDYGFEILAPAASGDTVTMFDTHVSGMLTIKGSTGEVAVFLLSTTDAAGGTGVVTAISESNLIGDDGSAKTYRVENLTGAFVLKKHAVDATLTSVQYWLN